MADVSFKADFSPRLPGKTRAGSAASHRKASTKSAREQMAEIIRRYDQIVDDLTSATPGMIRRALEPVFERSQVYVPKRTGALMRSGELNVVKVGPQIRGTIKYGNAEAWYAALVHEQTWKKHRSPERSKYLQAALEEGVGDFLAMLALEYAARIGAKAARNWGIL